MPMTINEARDVQLHRREADGGATPLHPATCADVVAYSNADPAAGFDGTTARQALDELFRRLNAAEEAIPPVVAAPEIVQPTAAQVVPEGESLALKATPFALSAGRDSHAASEWKISGADGRQLWSSGEDAAHLESFPGLVPNRETLPGVTTGAAPGSVIRGIVHDDLFTSFSTNRFFMVKGGGATRFAFFKEAKASLRFLRVSEDDGATWRNAGVGAELPTSPMVNIVWTGNRLLSFLFERNADVPVYASDDLGATWEKIGVLPFKYASSLDVCHIQAQAENGRIVLAARNDYRFDMCVSKDHGATWTPVTLEEGKVVSYTNEIYTAVENMAEEHFQQTLTALADQGLTVEQAVMGQPFLRGWSDSGYVQWELQESVLLQKPTEDLLDDYPYGIWPRWVKGTEDYLLTEGTTLLDTGPYFGNPDAYVRYCLRDQMTFQPELRWPWDMETVLADCLESGDHWIEDRDEVARRYTEALGEEAVSMTVLEDDLTGAGAPSGTIALMEIETGGGRTFRLLLSQCSADVYGTEYSGQCWQVEAFQTEDGSLLLPEGSTLLVEQAEASDLLEAGTYLALRDGSAYRLETFAAAYVAAMEQNLPAVYPDYTFGTPAITGFTWAGRSVTRDGRTIEKILVEWEIPVSPPAEESVWGEMGPDQVTEGSWQFADSTILLIEHTDSSVLRTYVGTNGLEFSYDRNFWQQAERILDAMSVPLEVSPAIFYDWEMEELFAVSTHPAEIRG